LAIIYSRLDSEIQLLAKYPKEVRKIEDISRVYRELKDGLGKEEGFFAFARKWRKKRQIKKFEKNQSSPFFAGARGERQVLERLCNLSNEYHIFCGVRIRLPRAIRYRGKKNLRSAQMDFVVVSKKGVFVIEVKNWSDEYTASHCGFSPYEQTERAGRVLWTVLKFMEIRVTDVLLSVQGNLRYDSNYRMVLVSSLGMINKFLEKRKDFLSENDVKRVVGKLELLCAE